MTFYSGHEVLYEGRVTEDLVGSIIDEGEM